VEIRVVKRLFSIGILWVCTSFSMAQDSIKYVGSSTVGKFIHEAATVYTAASFDINTKPESGGGENAMVVGMADVGGVAREVGLKILARGVRKFLIGKDAIGAWVNQKNSISVLSTSQLRQVFSGQITNWKDLGGNDVPITLYIVKPQSATRKVFNKKLLGGDKYGGSVETIRPDSKIIDKVAGDIGGIGQLSFALGDSHPKASMVKKLGIDGQLPSVENPYYPVTRPLYLITKGEPVGKIKAFIDWSLSKAGQEVVKRYFVGK
jgi:phosphate transport system substrate-binding protein